MYILSYEYDDYYQKIYPTTREEDTKIKKEIYILLDVYLTYLNFFRFFFYISYFLFSLLEKKIMKRRIKDLYYGCIPCTRIERERSKKTTKERTQQHTTIT